MGILTTTASSLILNLCFSNLGKVLLVGFHWTRKYKVFSRGITWSLLTLLSEEEEQQGKEVEGDREKWM